MTRLGWGLTLTLPVIVRISPVAYEHILRLGTLTWVRVRDMAGVKPQARRLTSEETYAWLEKQMSKRGFTSLEDLARASGIDRGTLSRYFRQERRPSVDVIAPLCEALNVAPESLLIALGAVDRKR